MARIDLNKTYNCYNDCQLLGCPGHNAELTIQTVSDSYTFDDGRGQAITLNPTTLGVLVDLYRKANYYPVPGIER